MADSLELSLADIRQEMLNVLKKIIQICDEIHINYFIAYGSLIGAVRHKGFIPWDDDLDIEMTRPEFDKFVNYCETHSEKLKPYKLVSFHNSPIYPYAIPRFCDTRFRMEKGGMSDAGMGVFVDVYPLDGIGNDVLKAKRKLYFKKMYWQMCWLYKREGKFVKSEKSVFRDFLRFLIYLSSLGRNITYYLKKIESISSCYSFDDSVFIWCTWCNVFCPQRKEWYSDYDYLDFEGLKVKAPKNYDKVLRNIYGDYMQLPPVEDRLPSHNYRIFKRE